MAKQGSVIVIKGEPREFLKEALENGLLNGEALRATQAVMKENQALRNENTILKGMLAGRREVIRIYRAEHQAALRYQFDMEKGWRYGREHRLQIILITIGLTMALTIVAYSVALFA